MPTPSAMTGWPQWAVMWALAAAVFALLKWLTWQFTPVAPAPAWRHVAYLFLWPGLDAKAFLDPRPLPREERPTLGEWLFAAAKVALGAALVWVAVPLVPAGWWYLRAWVGMAGIVFVLHFGTFHLLSCAWRAAGVDAKPIMNWPLLSEDVSEFWGKRWNLAFRDLTHRFLFRPLAARWSARAGLVAVFVFSGVVHDLVISLPACGGYGLPTLYFVIQAAALFVERSKFGKRFGLGRGVRGWLFTAVVLVAPACLLFHPWFAREVIVPFLGAVGAA
jgi:alginate O-acetyltransferase complex protein AlgI